MQSMGFLVVRPWAAYIHPMEIAEEANRQPDRRTDAQRFDDAMSAILAAPKDKVEAKVRAKQCEAENLKNGADKGRTKPKA